MPTYAGGVQAIQAEFAASGTPSDNECLDYILNQRAGSSEIVFSNGNRKRDCDPEGQVYSSRLDGQGRGMTFADFVAHPHSRVAHLQEAHVLALRLYTTAAFRSLNVPLRDTSLDRPPHPFPVTINYIKEGISQLRAVADSGESDDSLDLWRGLRNLKAQDGFLRTGGNRKASTRTQSHARTQTRSEPDANAQEPNVNPSSTTLGTELAPMSTTTDLSVAVAYSMSSSSLLFKINTKSFMQRGADLSYLSAFPGEAEVCFPPLTYLRPTGRKLELTHKMITFTVIEVEPTQ